MILWGKPVWPSINRTSTEALSDRSLREPELAALQGLRDRLLALLGRQLLEDLPPPPPPPSVKRERERRGLAGDSVWEASPTQNLDGNRVELAAFAGNVSLVVNLATF